MLSNRASIPPITPFGFGRVGSETNTCFQNKFIYLFLTDKGNFYGSEQNIKFAKMGKGRFPLLEKIRAGGEDSRWLQKNRWREDKIRDRAHVICQQ